MRLGANLHISPVFVKSIGRELTFTIGKPLNDFIVASSGCLLPGGTTFQHRDIPVRRDL